MNKTMDKVEIYQTKSRDLLFMRYDSIKDKSLIKKENYDKVYAFEGCIREMGRDNEREVVFSKLESIFKAFNCYHPIGFRGHSLSVSDVVCLNGEYYFCDSFGFEKIDF